MSINTFTSSTLLQYSLGHYYLNKQKVVPLQKKKVVKKPNNISQS